LSDYDHLLNQHLANVMQQAAAIGGEVRGEFKDDTCTSSFHPLTAPLQKPGVDM
jgi:hypothetical protein